MKVSKVKKTCIDAKLARLGHLVLWLAGPSARLFVQGHLLVNLWGKLLYE